MSNLKLSSSMLLDIFIWPGKDKVYKTMDKKDMNKETLGLTDEDLDSVSKEFGLTAESIEDLLRL